MFPIIVDAYLSEYASLGQRCVLSVSTALYILIQCCLSTHFMVDFSGLGSVNFYNSVTRQQSATLLSNAVIYYVANVDSRVFRVFLASYYVYAPGREFSRATEFYCKLLVQVRRMRALFWERFLRIISHKL